MSDQNKNSIEKKDIADSLDEFQADVENKIVRKAVNIELIVAVCAVFISIASFYATYIQANAAEKASDGYDITSAHFFHRKL